MKVLIEIECEDHGQLKSHLSCIRSTLNAHMKHKPGKDAEYSGGSEIAGDHYIKIRHAEQEPLLEITIPMDQSNKDWLNIFDSKEDQQAGSTLHPDEFGGQDFIDPHADLCDAMKDEENRTGGNPDRLAQTQFDYDGHGRKDR